MSTDNTNNSDTGCGSAIMIGIVATVLAVAIAVLFYATFIA